MNNTDREKLINWIRYTYVSNPPYTYKATVDDTADAVIADMLIANGMVVREKGEWLDRYGELFKYKCSLCDDGNDTQDNFCPNCGADMRKKN